MTVGIYKLTFADNSIYIGQSVNIEKRIINHLCEMRKDNSSIKLQKAYNLYGSPLLEILEECSLEKLDKLEIEYIQKFNSQNCGLNTSSGGHSSYKGYSTNEYSIEDYKEVLFYLTNTLLTIQDIVDITEVSSTVVKKMSSLEGYQWLEEADPENYAKLKELRSKGNKRSAISQGKKYPKIVSPEGLVYEVFNVTQFCKEHNLRSGPICAVLNGTSATSLGWHLETTTIEKFPTIISPEGVEYTIPYRGCKPFAREHNLHPSDLAKVLRGTLKQTKGWKVA